ncbi:flagellar protein FlgN [Sporolactobacillus vineae]|uniref:flagellar protein FlgN n=1 Tax=Sporolactobacillus vineae TaxID=444463 RepID=UPI000289B308|nr:flagellar protein FlgN [Sporolactobacillus vineae]
MPVSSMKALINQLISVHRELYTIAAAKTEAIKTGDGKAVARLSKEEMPLVSRLQRLEERRIAEVAADLPDRAPTDPAPTFSDWEAVAVSERERPEWKKLYLELAGSVLRLKQANALNQELLRQSIQWVRLSMNLLRPQPQPGNYTDPRSGQNPGQGFSGRIDSRA